MAQADIVYAEELTAQDDTSTGSDSYQSVLTSPLADWVAGTKYLIIANAQVGGNHADTDFQHRLTHGSTPTQFPGSEMIFQAQTVTLTNCHLYGWAGEFTQPGGGAEDIDHEHLTPDTAQTVRADTIQIKGISLDDLAAGDWASGEVDDISSPVAHSTTPNAFADRATTGAFSCTSGDVLMVIAHVSLQINSAAVNWRAEIDLDSGTQLVEASQEGETANGQESFVMMRAFVATGSSHTFKVRTCDDGTPATQNDHLRSYIIVINLTTAPYEQVEMIYDATEAQAVSSTLEQIASATPETPDIRINHATAGAVSMFAYSSHDVDNATRASKIQIKSGADTSEAEVPAGGTSNQYMSFDPTDKVPMFVQAHETGLSTGNRDYQFWVQAQNTAATKIHNSLVIFTHELAAGEADTTNFYGARQRVA